MVRSRGIDPMTVYLSDEEEARHDPPPKRRSISASSSNLASVGSASHTATPVAMQMTDVQLHHLLLAKGMVAVHHTAIMRRLQRRLSNSLRAPSLNASGRVKVVLDGFEMAALNSQLPRLEQVRRGGELHLVAWTPDAFRAACFFPFHALGFREGKLFKPARVREARAICFYSPPMQFVHRRQMVAGVEETSLTVLAQISMLNHAGVLLGAKAPPVSTKANEYLAFTGYSESDLVKIKMRGIELLQEFLDAPMAKKIPLSAGLTRVAKGMSDEQSEASMEAASAEGEHLEPMPLA